MGLHCSRPAAGGSDGEGAAALAASVDAILGPPPQSDVYVFVHLPSARAAEETYYRVHITAEPADIALAEIVRTATGPPFARPEDLPFRSGSGGAVRAVEWARCTRRFLSALAATRTEAAPVPVCRIVGVNRVIVIGYADPAAVEGLRREKLSVSHRPARPVEADGLERGGIFMSFQ